MAGGHGFQIWNLLYVETFQESPHIAAGLVGALTLISAALVYRLVTPRLNLATGDDKDFVPPSKLNLRNVFDLVGEFVQSTAQNIIGKHYADYLVR